MMRILFVCSTEYQILNALNIKLHIFPDLAADIILQRAEYSGIADRLKELNIFENVCCGKEIIFDLHEYKLAWRETGSSPVSLGKATVNTVVKLWRKALGAVLGPKYHLKHLVNGYDNIRDKHYDKVLMQSANAIVCNIYDDLHKDSEMAILDEGTRSYGDNVICREGTKADAVYLYDPEMAIYFEDKSINYVKIPQLSAKDEAFVNIVNKVFAYVPQHNYIKNQLIFFDQGGEQMPKYLQNPNWLVKLLLANSIKKHMQPYKEYISQVKAFKYIAANRTVYIKYHPRTPDGMLKEFEGEQFKSIEPRKLPWELYALNNQIDECKLISVCSSSVSLFPMTVGGNNKCVLLHECVDYNMGDKYKLLFEKIAQKYKDEVFIATNIDDVIEF